MSDHVDELLSLYLDNEASVEERVKVENHLQNCVECREKYQQLSLYKEEISLYYETIDIPSIQFEQSVIQKIKNLAPQNKEKMTNTQWIVAICSMMLFALILFKIGPFLYIGMKLTATLFKVGYSLINVLAVIMSSVPYFVAVTVVVILIVIFSTSWFLHQLLESKTIG